jgi:hypothetical protein
MAKDPHDRTRWLHGLNHFRREIEAHHRVDPHKKFSVSLNALEKQTQRISEVDLVGTSGTLA